MTKDYTAVVTGANGFVGSHLVDLLLEKGFKVRCIVRKSSNLRWLKDKDVEIIDSGLRDKDGLRKAFNGAQYIFHVAGVVKSKKPQGYFDANVENTRVLLDTALEFKDKIKRFVIVSSQTATGPSLDGNPVTEKTECKPITTYGRSKLAQEKLAMSYMSQIPITICRAPAVYGERDTEILIYFQTFVKGLTTSIGFDKKLVSLIHVRDLVEGIVQASLSQNAEGQIYFISSEKFYSWEEVGELTSKILNKKPIRIKVPHFMVYLIAAIAQFFALFKKTATTLNIEKARDITQHAWICSTEKAKTELGFKENISLEEGIKQTTDWYKEMKWI